MPFAKKTTTELGVLGIWELTDPLENLVSIFQFSVIEKEEYNKIKAEKRKTEYLAVRLLLQTLLQEKQEIQYHKSGKPRLKTINKNISISHSAQFAIIFISDKNTGIDVEDTRRNIEKVASRFLHEEELKHIQSLSNQQTAKILYWSAKEAIFKCTSEENVEFKKQIIIHPFVIKKEGTFTGTLNKNVPYKLWYIFYENNVIVYCVEQIDKRHETN